MYIRPKKTSPLAMDILPQESLSSLDKGLKFLEEFQANTLPATDAELLALLDRATGLMDTVAEAIRMYEFLGNMQVDRIATNDNDIAEHGGAFERELAVYKLMHDGVSSIRDRVMRVLSR